MNTRSTLALSLGLALALSAPISAVSPDNPDTDDVDQVSVVVVNHHGEDVRVFAERADGRLVLVDRVRAGDARSLVIPAEVAASDYRLKVVRVPVDIWDPIKDLTAVKTPPLSPADSGRLVLWLDEDLADSGVERLTP